MPKREPEACMPCRGTGRVVSNLGGEQRLLACPWCKGGGMRLSGVDAQEAWVEDDAGGQKAAAESDAEAIA